MNRTTHSGPRSLTELNFRTPAHPERRTALRLGHQCAPALHLGQHSAPTPCLPSLLLARLQLLFKRSHLLGQEGVDYVEFLAATLHLGRLERDERLWRAFRHFDTDNTGFISRTNLVSALPHLGKKVRRRGVGWTGKLLGMEVCRWVGWRGGTPFLGVVVRERHRVLACTSWAR